MSPAPERHAPFRGAALGALLASSVAIAGCGRAERRPPAAASLPLAVQVLADTAHGPAAPPPPPVQVWLARVSPTRPAPLDLPPPDAPPDTTLPETAPALALEAGLQPPVLMAPAPLVPPRPSARGSVELDVQVSERGDVTATAWAGGSADTALVRAATACARAMRFLPARRGGEPVAVWCRQRFDFGAGAPR